MSELELNAGPGGKSAGLGESSKSAVVPTAETLAVPTGSGGPELSSEGTCTLVAKWQGSTIELPVLPKTTTIGEVKVSSGRMHTSVIRRS